MQRGVGLLLFAAVSSGPAITVAGTAEAGIGARYEFVLNLYAEGRHAEAVAALAEFPWKELDDGWQLLELRMRALRSCPTCPDTLLDRLPLKAAAMLHFDVDVALRPANVVIEQPPTCSGRHARRASQFAELLALRVDGRDFARRFYLVMAQRAQWDACLDEAIEWWGHAGLERFPNDPELLLTVGAAHEKYARLTDRSPTPHLRNALGPLAAAVQADPALLQARLHLGRVQWRLGELDEARRTLQNGIAQGGEADERYLAHLFLGQVHAQAGRADAAVEALQTALGIDPAGQAAAAALAQVLLLRGDTTAARAVVDRALTRPRDHFDPHWNYLSSNATDIDDRLDDLRAECGR